MPQQVKTPSRRKELGGSAEIGFQKGINTFQANRLLLENGECATLVNADLSYVGYLGILKGNTSYKTGLSGRIHTLYKTGDNLFIGHGTGLSHIDVSTGTLTDLSLTFDGSDLHMISYENFLYCTDGSTHYKVYIPTLATSIWGIDNPLTAPSGALGETGNPSGTYSLYYTYVAKYPDGTEYETDLSPVGTIAVADGKIEWTYPATVPDSQINYIRLYRDKTGIYATLDQVRSAVEGRQVELETATGKKKFSNILQSILRSATNKRITQNMVADQNQFAGPFFVDEVAVGSVGYTDNLSDDVLVTAVPFARERYVPIFGG